VGLEAILGFDRRGDLLRIAPRVPLDWPELTIDYRFGATRYTIVVDEPGRFTDGAPGIVTLDGRVLDGPEILLVDDGMEHQVHVCLQGPLQFQETGSAGEPGQP
jgi:cyclic beta-1,2-glucan synthetase